MENTTNLTPLEKMQRMAALQNDFIAQLLDAQGDLNKHKSEYQDKISGITKHICAISVEIGRLETNNPEVAGKSKFTIEDLRLLKRIQVYAITSRYTGLQSDEMDDYMYNVAMELLSFKDESECIEWSANRIFWSFWLQRVFKKQIELIVKDFQECAIDQSSNKRKWKQAITSLSGTTENYEAWIAHKQFCQQNGIIVRLFGDTSGLEPESALS